MKYWNLYIDKIIPDKLKSSPVEYRKSLVLVWTHLFLIVTIIIFTVTNLLIFPVSNASETFMYGMPLVLFSLFLLYKFENLIISGNIVACIWFIYFGSYVFRTGGLYSNDIVWLMIAPLFALLLANRISGAIWLGLVTLFDISIYILGDYYPNLNRVVDSQFIYMFCYIAIAILLFIVIWIFEIGQKQAIKDLSEKNGLLEQQKLAIAKNVSDLQQIEQKLLLTNEELQNFAYAASHDLKEPLRMINMYTQLMQKRINGQLDERTGEYMFFITDGVKRMQSLLDDLLKYSRLGRNTEDVSDVDLNNTLLMVVYNLTVVMKETGASITSTPLPTVVASATEMTQIFQNLIANAIKFRRSDLPPSIQIAHIENPQEHLFSLSDNGIGIKKEHQEKVFNIFTRLHTRNEYEGSGIGLATCKKIITNHNGRIWLASTEGVGTTFYFTISKNRQANPVFESASTVVEN